MKCSIHNVELICPVCVGAKGGRNGGKAATEAKKKAARRNVQKARKAHIEAAKQRKAEQPAPVKLDRKNIWGITECRNYFETHPNMPVRSEDLIKSATPKKRESARRYAGQRLIQLAQRGEIVQIERGVYQKNQ